MREPIDLANERLRGYVLAASDEFFAQRESLLHDEEPVYLEEEYDFHGKWMDGWQTQYRRRPGHEWAIVRLGVPGVVEEVVLDTTHFSGNYAPVASLEGCVAPHNAQLEELTEWTEILPRSELGPDRKNQFHVSNRYRFTHVRLNIYPDGGIARLRVLGQPVPRWMAPGVHLFTSLDLAALVNGGHVHSASDTHYGDAQNLIGPGESLRMDQGWETQRRRGPGHDWAILRLVGPGSVRALTLDTAHFKGNCPEKAQIEATCVQDPAEDDWFELLPPQSLVPHTEHYFQEEIQTNQNVLWLRLNIFPDGGIARLRVWGDLNEEGLSEARLLYLNSSRPEVLKSIFKQVCHSERWVSELCGLNPYFSLADLLNKGASAWSRCAEDDWKEALEGHPRIGEKASGSGLSAQWSKKEQSAAQVADDDILNRLREAQAGYFQKFGFIFLICASGRSSEEILREVERRMNNSPAEEMQILAAEQGKIIHLRLEKLLK